MDFRALSPELGRFVGIAALASLIHIRDEELAQVFKSMKTVLNKDGFIMAIVIEGRGLSPEHSFIERNSKKYRRSFYLHDKAALTAAAGRHNLSYYTEFELPEDLKNFGWKSFVFKSETLA